MRIIHISDTHIGFERNLSRFNAVADDLIANPPDEPSRCVVLHTGDLIDAAMDANRLAAKKILARLEACGYCILMCPGNHDYGDKLKIDRADAAVFLRDFSSYIFQGEQADFPVMHEVDDCVFIGMDSNEAELGFWERWFAEGYLGSVQLDKLNCMLDRVRGKFVILYLHHHPFYYGYSVMPDVGDKNPLLHLFAWLTRPFRRLKDAYSLCQIVRDRVQVLCFGHMHHGLDSSSESQKYGIPLALDGGSTTCTDDDSDRMRYRIIDTKDLSQTMRMIKISRS
ncbi:MAG: metallophosphoesterase [Proteobacteria bacterium]|nr:metallophosphoesterase [Pseudomonadota bacterium]